MFVNYQIETINTRIIFVIYSHDVNKFYLTKMLGFFTIRQISALGSYGGGWGQKKRSLSAPLWFVL